MMTLGERFARYGEIAPGITVNYADEETFTWYVRCLNGDEVRVYKIFRSNNWLKLHGYPKRRKFKRK